MSNFKENPLTEVIFLRLTTAELNAVQKGYKRLANEDTDSSLQAFIRRLVREALKK